MTPLIFCLAAVGAPDGFVVEHDPLRLAFGFNFESSVVLANDFRKGGGNELSFGDFLVNPAVEISADKKPWSLSFYFDWVPEDSVLTFADPAERNEHNHNILRADGYVSRPDVLAHLGAAWQVAPAHHLHEVVGGFRASGLGPLAAMGRYYLNTPLPLLHTQHFDKGVELAYLLGEEPHPTLDIAVSVVDGDWAIGEPSLFTLGSSAANSSPSFAAHAFVRPIDPIRIGVSGTLGKTGSNPGQKRRQNSLVAFIEMFCPVGQSELAVRGFGTYTERNPAGDSNGGASPVVDTVGYGAEIALSRIRAGDLELTAYATGWGMTRQSDQNDGEIWFNRSDEAWGYGAGLRFDGVFVDQLYVTAQCNRIDFNKNDGAFVFNIAVGVEL